MDYAELRQSYPKFIYQNFSVKVEEDALILQYSFEIPSLARFTPSLIFDLKYLPHKEFAFSGPMRRLAFRLGLVELISYWKCACPPLVELRCGDLREDELNYWYELYWGGLSEFRYRNNISEGRETFLRIALPSDGGRASQDEAPNDFFGKGNAEVESEESVTQPEFLLSGGRLIPVGGGKDSVVTLMRLAPLKQDTWAFAINPTRASLECMDIAGIPATRRVLPRRMLDKRLPELNAKGCLNGHTPFSAIVAFTGAIAAGLCGLRDLVLSNEASADEESVLDSEVNHQFSKTSAFEYAFAAYIKKILPGLRYFSLLRPFGELAIARQFSAYPQFFPAFLSCNLGSKTGHWCGSCAKCLFVAIALLPFLGEARVRTIIGHDIFADETLEPLLYELAGLRPHKPFECVGTIGEVNWALALYFNQKLDDLACAPEDISTAFPLLLARLARLTCEGKNPRMRWLSREGIFHAEGENPLRICHNESGVPSEYRPYIADFLPD